MKARFALSVLSAAAMVAHALGGASSEADAVCGYFESCRQADGGYAYPGQDVSHLNARRQRRAVRRHGLDAHSAQLCLLGDGDADAYIGIVHHFLVAAVFLRRQIVAPAVAGGLGNGRRRSVRQRLFIIVVDKIIIQIFLTGYMAMKLGCVRFL